MIRQTTNRFESKNAPHSNGVIIKKIETPKETKIINIDLIDDVKLNDDVLEYVKFKVDNTGYYNISNQLCIKHTSNTITKADFLQFGVCEAQSKNYDANFNSIIVNAECQPEYLISNNLSTVLELKADVEYLCWLNFSSSNNNNFSFNKQYSHLILYKL